MPAEVIGMTVAMKYIDSGQVSASHTKGLCFPARLLTLRAESNLFATIFSGDWGKILKYGCKVGYITRVSLPSSVLTDRNLK